MRSYSLRFTRQALFCACLLMGAGLVLSWEARTFATTLLSFNMPTAWVSLYLVAAIIASYYFPVSIRLHTKVQMTTIPLYLLAILCTPPLASIAAGVGILTAELLVQNKRKNKASDVIIQTARYIIILFPASWLGHLSPTSSGLHTLWLFAAAGILLVCDFLTCSLQMAILYQEPFWPTLLSCFKEVSIPEAALYLLGLLGALAAEQASWALLLLLLPTGILYLACKQAKEMHTSTRSMLENMADTVDLRDPYTGGHSRRVTEYTAQILDELGYCGPEVELIISASRVHDIGKIAIPDGVLNKPGPLNPEERTIMETHSVKGAEFLTRFPDFVRGVEIVRHHHESWDGTGYPDKLAGTDIPFGARVIAVADSFDAMTSDRPYRKGMPIAKAASILRKGRNQQWDATIVDAFLRTIADQLEEEATVVPAAVVESTLATPAISPAKEPSEAVPV